MTWEIIFIFSIFNYFFEELSKQVSVFTSSWSKCFYLILKLFLFFQYLIEKKIETEVRDSSPSQIWNWKNKSEVLNRKPKIFGPSLEGNPMIYRLKGKGGQSIEHRPFNRPSHTCVAHSASGGFPLAILLLNFTHSIPVSNTWDRIEATWNCLHGSDFRRDSALNEHAFTSYCFHFNFLVNRDFFYQFFLSNIFFFTENFSLTWFKVIKIS